MRRLLVLRPEPGASATVARARELGCDAISLPLFAVEPVPWCAPQPGAFDALLLTSANAVRHGGGELAKLRRWPVHAVGDATASAAREAGFDVQTTGAQGVDRLLASIAPQLRLLHLCGEHHRPPHEARQEITRIAVYRSSDIAAPELSEAKGGVALVHSPRAGRRFAELIEAAGLERQSIAIAAISAAAAEAAGVGWQAVEAAPRPSDEALLALAAALCNNSLHQ